LVVVVRLGGKYKGSERRLRYKFCDMFAGRHDGITWISLVIVSRLSCDWRRQGRMMLL
jgi:hypothetical protein